MTIQIIRKGMQRKYIKFLITGAGWKPIGGLKVIYEYANRLVSDGCRVDIFYAASGNRGQYTWYMVIKSMIKYMYFFFTRSFTCKSWFCLNSEIKEKWVWKLKERSVGNEADVYIATTVMSSYYLSDMQCVDNDKKYYFIQDFENWGRGITDEMVYNSYKLKLHKVVIANWLSDVVESMNEDSEIVYNGFDSKQFYITDNIETRSDKTVCMMYNTKESKGCEDCFKALDIVRGKHPDLKVNIFGVPPRPAFLPNWYNYYQRPYKQLHNKLYNESAIFIGASHTEGWGLTIGEAMLCGCAVACTDNRGYMEMAHDGKTALLSPIRNPSLLASNILRLIEDRPLRKLIAQQGNEFVRTLSIEASYFKFKSIIGC